MFLQNIFLELLKYYHKVFSNKKHLGYQITTRRMTILFPRFSLPLSPSIARPLMAELTTRLFLQSTVSTWWPMVTVRNEVTIDYSERT